MAILFDPVHPAHAVELRATREAAQTLEIRLELAEATTRDDFPGALTRILRSGATALIVLDGFANAENRVRIMEFGTANRLPIMSGSVVYTRAGGLISYTPDVPDLYRRAASYVDRILKGTKPADLPVEQPTKLLIVLNLGTAKTLGLTIPQSVLGRADEVIE